MSHVKPGRQHDDRHSASLCEKDGRGLQQGAGTIAAQPIDGNRTPPKTRQAI